MMKLYSYFRSSTSYRVRIALNLKEIDYTVVPVNILKGEQRSEEYRALNPSMGVPLLANGDFRLGQSLAIIEYLDSIVPQPPLISGAPEEKALIRQLSQIIASDIHPLVNLRVLNALTEEFAADEGKRTAWYRRWTVAGITAFEALLHQAGRSGNFCLGEQASMADACLIPQMYNLRRFKIPLDDYPLCRRIEAHCAKLQSFQKAAPEMQPDAPEGLEPIHGPLFKAA